MHSMSSQHSNVSVFSQVWRETQQPVTRTDATTLKVGEEALKKDASKDLTPTLKPWNQKPDGNKKPILPDVAALTDELNYIGVRLIPERLLAVDIEAHKFRIYFKLYVQVRLNDANIQEILDRSKLDKNHELYLNIPRDIPPLQASYDDNKTAKLQDIRKKFETCDKLVEQMLKTSHSGTLGSKPDIRFENSIGEVLVEKTVGSFKVEEDDDGEFLAFQVHQNCTSDFALCCQDRDLGWRMRKFPFDHYECCITICVSRHTQKFIDHGHVTAFNASAAGGPNAAGWGTQSKESKSKRTHFKQLGHSPDQKWMPNKMKRMNIGLVSNEWHVHQTADGVCESQFLDDDGTPYFQVSFGATNTAHICYNNAV